VVTNSASGAVLEELGEECQLLVSVDINILNYHTKMQFKTLLSLLRLHRSSNISLQRAVGKQFHLDVLASESLSWYRKSKLWSNLGTQNHCQISWASCKIALLLSVDK